MKKFLPQKMISYSTTNARKNFADIINQVKYNGKIVAIGRNKNHKEALIIPYPAVDQEDLPISQINEQSPSFEFLESEPDIYSLDDLKKRYV